MFLLPMILFFDCARNFYINQHDNKCDIFRQNIIRTKENNYRTFEYLVYCPQSLYCNQTSRHKNNDSVDEHISSHKKEILRDEPSIEKDNISLKRKQNVETEKIEINVKKNYRKYITIENFILVFSSTMAVITFTFYTFLHIRRYGKWSWIVSIFLFLFWPFRMLYQSIKKCCEREELDSAIFYDDVLAPEIV